MKKFSFTVAVILSAVSIFTGCTFKQETKKKESTKQQDEIREVSKAQKIQVISLNDQKAVVEIKNKDDIRSLIEDLKIDQWKTVKCVPEASKAVYRCDLYVAGTQKLDQKKSGSMRKMGSLTFYGDRTYALMNIRSLQLSFKIPVDAVQILEEL